MEQASSCVTLRSEVWTAQTGVSHLQQDKELKDSPEGWREQPGVRDGHLEEEGVEEAVSDVDEGVLVHVGVSDPVGSHVVVVVVVQRDVVVVGLVLRHDLWITGLTLHTLTADSRSAWLLRVQGSLTSDQMTLDSSHRWNCWTEPELLLPTHPDSLQPYTAVTWRHCCLTP